MQTNIYKYITSIMLGMIIGVVIHYYLWGNCTQIIENKVQFRDTIYEIKQSKPLIITKYKTKLEYRTDTIIETKPFTAYIDTVIVRDTVKASFDFPENTFSLNICSEQDTVIKERTFVTSSQKVNEIWWHKPALSIISVFGGYLLGRFTK